MSPDPYGSDRDQAARAGSYGAEQNARTSLPFVLCEVCKQDDEDVNQRRCRFCDSRKLQHFGRRRR